MKAFKKLQRQVPGLVAQESALFIKVVERADFLTDG